MLFITAYVTSQNLLSKQFLGEGRLGTVDLILTSFDELLFILKAIITFYKKKLP